MDNFSSNKTQNTSNRFKPRKLRKPKIKKSPSATIKKTPEQKKQEKIAKLKEQVANLRRQKNEMRTAYRLAKKDTASAEFRGKLDAIDQKITQKMQQMRDTASNVVQKVGQAVAAPAVGAKRVWDEWELR